MGVLQYLFVMGNITLIQYFLAFRLRDRTVHQIQILCLITSPQLARQEWHHSFLSPRNFHYVTGCLNPFGFF